MDIIYKAENIIEIMNHIFIKRRVGCVTKDV